MVHSGNCPPDKDIRIIGSSGLNGQILNRIEINSVSIKNLSISPKIFFSDPGRPWVWMSVRPHALFRLYWCDSGWWRYQLTNKLYSFVFWRRPNIWVISWIRLNKYILKESLQRLNTSDENFVLANNNMFMPCFACYAKILDFVYWQWRRPDLKTGWWQV